MTWDVNKFYTKVVELDEIKNFIVYNFSFEYSLQHFI